MDDLVAWLRAQLDDDERKVAAMEREQRRVQTAPIFQGHPPNWLAGVDIFVSPKRWRADVDAKRRVLDLVELAHREYTSSLPYLRGQDRGYREAMVDVLRELAMAYADHPGYRDEWRLVGVAP